MATRAATLRQRLCRTFCPQPKPPPLQLGGPTVTVFNTPPGIGHVRSVVAKMGELAKQGAHEWPIRQLAVEITKGIPSKSPTREIFAIYKWVREHIRYRMDPVGLELVQAPRITLKERAGDCDDITTLVWALCMALGHPVRGRTVGPSPEDQTHVQAQVFDRKRWLDVDPVLEKPQPTIAPREDVGAFAMFAGGAQHLWDLEGRMLGAPRRRRTVHVEAHTRGWPRPDAVTAALRRRGMSGLGAPANAVDRSLWQWCAYYPPWGAAFEHSGGQPPQPGVWTPPDSRYRGRGAPGYSASVMPTPVFYAFHAGQLPPQAALSGVFDVPELGGFFKKIGRGIKKGARAVGRGVKKGVTAVTSTAHKITHGKKSPIAKIHRGITSVAKKVPVLAPFVELQEQVFQPATEAILAKGGLIKSDKKMPTFKTLKRSLPAAASAAASSGGGKIPVVREAAARAQPVVSAGAKLKAKGKAGIKRLKAKAPKLKKTATPMKDAWKDPHPKLRAKYPPSARMLFDPGSKRFRVFIPSRAGVHGLGAVVPTLTFSIGSAPSTPAEIQATKDAAAKMEKAIRAFIDKNKRPPAISLPAVLHFQKTEGTLKADGLYGDNSRAAAEYYLGHSMPPHAPALKSKSGLTWKPPAKVVTTPEGKTVVVQPKPKPQPPPKPVVKPTPEGPKVVTPVQTDVVPTPSGYTEVGREANNPGLPPIGAPDTKPKPKPKPKVVQTPNGPVVVTEGPKTDGLPAPAWTQLPPEEIEILREHAYKPTPDATYMVVPDWQPGDPLPSQQYGIDVHHGGAQAVPDVEPVYVPAGPKPHEGVPIPGLDPTPLPGPVYPHDVDPEYGMSYDPRPYATRERDDTWLWLALGYLALRDRKRAA